MSYASLAFFCIIMIGVFSRIEKSAEQKIKNDYMYDIVTQDGSYMLTFTFFEKAYFDWFGMKNMRETERAYVEYLNNEILPGWVTRALEEKKKKHDKRKQGVSYA